MEILPVIVQILALGATLLVLVVLIALIISKLKKDKEELNRELYEKNQVKIIGRISGPIVEDFSSMQNEKESTNSDQESKRNKKKQKKKRRYTILNNHLRNF